MKEAVIQNELGSLKKLFLDIFRQVENNNDGETINNFGSINFFHSRNSFAKHIKSMKQQFSKLKGSQSKDLSNYLLLNKEDKLEKQKENAEKMKDLFSQYSQNYLPSKSLKTEKKEKEKGEAIKVMERLSEIAKKLKIDEMNEEFKFTFFADYFIIDIILTPNHKIERIETCVFVNDEEIKMELLSKQFEFYLKSHQFTQFENCLFQFTKRESIFFSFQNLRKLYQSLSSFFEEKLFLSFPQLLQLDEEKQILFLRENSPTPQNLSQLKKKYLSSCKLQHPFQISFFFFSDPISSFQFFKFPDSLRLNNKKRKLREDGPPPLSPFPFESDTSPPLQQSTQENSKEELLKQKEKAFSFFSYKASIDVEEKRREGEEPHLVIHFSPPIAVTLSSLPFLFPYFSFTNLKLEKEFCLSNSSLSSSSSKIPPTSSSSLNKSTGHLHLSHSNFFQNLSSARSSHKDDFSSSFPFLKKHSHSPSTENPYSPLLPFLLNKKHAFSFASINDYPKTSFSVKIPNSPFHCSFNFSGSVWEEGACRLSSVPLPNLPNAKEESLDPSSFLNTSSLDSDSSLSFSYFQEIDSILHRLKTFLTFNHLVKSFVDLKTISPSPILENNFNCQVDLQPPNQIDLTLLNPKTCNLFCLTIKIDSKNNLPISSFSINPEERFCQDNECTQILQNSFSIPVLLSFIFNKF